MINYPLRAEAYFKDVRFWAFYFGDGSGQANDPPNLRLAGGEIARAWETAGSWWGLQRAEMCEDPLLIDVARRGEIALILSLGEEFDLVLQTGRARRIIGNVGGHWKLPSLRFAELENIVRESSCLGTEALSALLLLPFVWLCNEDEIASAKPAYGTWFRTIIPDQDEVGALTAEWIRSVTAVGNCRWVFSNGFWVNDCGESPRNLAATESATIGQQLITLVG